jgi:hypothetical protein
LDDNSCRHERVNLAMVGESASFSKGVAERSAIGRDGGIDTGVERCAIILCIYVKTRVSRRQTIFTTALVR